jgi:hypothetical protein
VPQSGEVGLSAGRVEHSEISEHEHVRQDRTREAKPKNIKHTVSAGTLSGIVLRNHDRRLRSAMRALGDTCVGSIERGHCRSPYQAPPLKRPRLVVVYSGPGQPQLQTQIFTVVVREASHLKRPERSTRRQCSTRIREFRE